MNISLNHITAAQNDVLNQIVYLDDHFKKTHQIECFSQSVNQFMRKLGYCRTTIKSAIKKLEDLGIISVAKNQGFKGANLFYVHLDKLEELRKQSLEGCSNATEKVKNVFWRYMTDAVFSGKTDLSEPEQAGDFASYARNTFQPDYFVDQDDYAVITILDTAINGLG
ncbi:hypothetical protein KI743_18315 [Vibrio sp. D420a]|uniref:helix-turn-helix domain-containing protein n=1 Tax=Vibrio sp. D420a TaxID=2836895 RepID=UPI0025546A44|nr:hypothetical protein [Vibrio sp. D420a]MDK9763964.1 hypothetical protein [Vibrio sp. D420a]